MDFPTRIRSEVFVAVPRGSTNEDIRERVSRQLLRKGAIVSAVTDDAIEFRVEGAVLNINPLSQCRKEAFKVKTIPVGSKVSYDLDVTYLVQRFGFSVFLSVPIILLALFAALFGRACILLIFLAVSYFGGLPVSYLILSWQARGLFRRAVMSG